MIHKGYNYIYTNEYNENYEEENTQSNFDTDVLSYILFW